MNNEWKRLPQLIEDIFETQTTELGCMDATAIIARLAAGNTPVEQARDTYPQLWHHFGVCSDCREEYGMVMSLAQELAAGELTAPKTLPSMPSENQSMIGKRVENAISALFPQFAPPLSGALGTSRGGELGEPVEFTLGDVLIIADANVNIDDSSKRDLLLTLEDNAAQAPSPFEGMAIWLLNQNHAVLQEQSVDASGDAAFFHLDPGSYLVLFNHEGKDFVVNGVIVPGDR